MLYQNKEKLNQISLTASNYAVLIDFDRTMTTIDSDDSWTVIQNPKFLDPNLSVESNKLANQYCPIEMDYRISQEEKSNHMYNWYSQVLNLYYQYGLTKDKLISCVKYGNLTLRSGLKELFAYFHQMQVPVIVVSAGIGNVIEEALTLHHCLYDNIYIMSNFFSFENNVLLPFDHPIIHTCNKNINALPISIKQNIEKKDYFLLLGDFIEDIHMVPKEDLAKTLSFGFLEKNVETNFEPYQNAFDIVLTDNTSFHEVQTIIEHLFKT